jgi:glycyl-tRNA synthetase beta chain
LPKEIKEKKCIYEVDENLFEKEQEKKLYESYKAIYSILEKNIANYEYGLFFNELIKLCPYINDFFDNVLVMAKDEKIRNNRLGLIYNIYSKLSEFADLTKLSV